ncbi:tRNA lysidine(34) synthetase TilS [Haliovirga abyssi]|uniref:tRNA(Ile)-lysidine synthase n=1 Tax=Haliovirga abyssi TaxID=2996794 RepID=A0AAU9DCF7_9FUSO|nr:tRNA lysidine(34) synthetase TilS [Haliovirga abyssi]BDU49982.1 tRNA(Ile)-lysidine synthase [Haliovirga abyssi]
MVKGGEKIKNKVLLNLKENSLINKKDKIVIGISGGADSVALFHLLMELKEELQINFIFAHVNHMLRGTADRDQRFVEELGKKYNVPVYVLKKNIKKYAKENKIGGEEAGREIRYSFFKEILNKTDADKIALAHNLNDVVETFMFRLMRGTSLNGLSSIPIKRGKFIRPILNISKEKIYNYLNEKGYKYVTDETNFQDIYTRNKIRLNLIPYIKESFNVKFEEKIIKLVSEIDETNRYFEGIISKINLENEIYISELKKYDEFIQRKIINKFLSNKEIEINSNKIYEILNILNSGGTLKLDLTKEFILVKEYDIIKIVKRNKIFKNNLNGIIENLEKELKIGEEILYKNKLITTEVVEISKMQKDSGKRVVYLDYNKLKDKEKFVIRSRKNGDYFYPNGMNGKKKLKNFFIDMKIPKDERDNIIIILNENEIISVENLRYNKKYQITEETKYVVMLIIREV